MKTTPILLIALFGMAANALGQPTITSHPRSQSVSLGANVTFSVRGSGVAPLSYQWRLAGVDISGTTTNSLVLTNIQSLHAGDYTAVVTNASGSVTSLVAILQVDPTFTKITAGNIATEGGGSTACAWADYDNDGWPDLFVNNRDSRNFLYRNKRDGTFEKITTGHLVTNIATHLAGVWGDYDNDGYLDMLVVNGGCCAGNQRNFLYHNNGDGTFSQQTAGTVGEIVADAGGFHGAAWGDYDGDGYPDVIVANFTGSNYLYRNVGGTNFMRAAALGSTGAEAAWADYDSDGDLDLVVIQHASSSGKTLLYRNDGHGLLTRVTTGSIVVEGAHSAGCSWGDSDNDGLFDLFVANINLERNFFYRNKGDGALDKITNRDPVNENAHTYGAIWGDYDNDGFLDLFVSNDPSFAGTPPEKNFLYRNNGNSNHWLKVRCVGTVSNRAGIGAKVRVKAMVGGQDRRQLRQIASSDGRTGGSLEAHFGLGDATIIDTVRIEWPSGIVQELHGVSAKQHLTMTEPARLEAHVSQANGIVDLKVKSWKGFAYDIETSNDLTAWTHLTTLTNETGTLEFADPVAGEAAQHFYRAVGK